MAMSRSTFRIGPPKKWSYGYNAVFYLAFTKEQYAWKAIFDLQEECQHELATLLSREHFRKKLVQ